MQQMRSGYHSLSTLIAINSDRVLATSAIAGAMLLGAWIQTL